MVSATGRALRLIPLSASLASTTSPRTWATRSTTRISARPSAVGARRPARTSCCRSSARAMRATAPLARAQDVPPDQLVKSVTLEVVDLIAKDKEIKAGNRARLVQLIDAKVLPHFNFSAMTALAMGQGWNKANAEQKKRLTEEFRTLLVRTYASALAAYSEQKFEFRPLRAKPTDTDVTVNVRVLQPGAQPVPVDYSMEKTTTGWK